MDTHTTALVLLELQNDFLAPEGKLYPLLEPVLEAQQVVRNLNALMGGARARGVTVVHVPLQFSADYREMGSAPYGILKIVKDAGALVRGSWGADVPSFIDLREGDLHIEGKSGIDAFASTHLNYVLRSRGIRSIALAGQLTNICIESTMRTAYDLGYEVLGVTDATATVDLETYRASVEHNWPVFCKPVTQAQWLETLSP